jgi:hypothetical protein
MTRPEFPESAAGGALAEVYEDIRRTLGTPVVNLIYRILAAYSPYLELAWPEMRANLRTVYAERAFDAIRDRAAEPLPELTLDRLPDPGPHLKAIAATAATYNEVNPKGLLGVTGWLRALRGEPPRGAGRDSAPAGPPRRLPPAPPMVELDGASPELRELLETIRVAHGLGGVPSLYRTLAWWPDWLADAWPKLAPLIASPKFAAQRADVVALAEQLAAGLPYPVTTTRERLRQAGMADGEIDEIDEVLGSFQRGIPLALITGLTIRRSLPEY